uniref:CSON003847 protein n=1 Tax=Culicoides sonorensis TaxID=179676 RepID=A0A336MS43_CULSO
MGKRLPKPKRHFGVRDPLKQLEEREYAIKDKINNPPAKDENQQKLSQKMRKFVELKNQAKEADTQKKSNKNKKKKNKKDTVGEKSQLVRRPQESEESYLKRLKRLKNERLTESLYAAKYNVRITRNEETGEMQVNQGQKNEIDELIEQKKKGYRPKKKKDDTKLTPLEKLKLKKLQKLEKKLVNDDDFKPQREIIPFGERVDAPPTLVVPRKATRDESGNPKRNRSGLLLNEVMKKNQDEIQKQKVERERESIVKLYKEFKKKKRLETKLTGNSNQRNEKGMSSL